MAKIPYEDPRNMRPATRELLCQILGVVEDYGRQGYVGEYGRRVEQECKQTLLIREYAADSAGRRDVAP